MKKTHVFDQGNYPRWILVNDQGKAYTDDQESQLSLPVRLAAKSALSWFCS